jgi:hypothetical protein
VILLLSKTPDPTTLEFLHRPSPHQPSSGLRSARRLRPPSGPEGGGESTSQGRSYGIFQKAIQRRNVVAALAAARELPQLSLEDALELTLLVARKTGAAISGSQHAGCCATSKKIPRRLSRRSHWPRLRSSPSQAPVIRRRCKRSGPWPKQPLGDGNAA